MKNGPGDPRWGWKMLMEDLRTSPQPEQPIQSVQPPQQVERTSPITNIVNYPPMTSTRFNFASAFVTIMFVIFLICLGLWLWKTGVIADILTAFGI